MSCESCDCPLNIRDKIQPLALNFEHPCPQCALPQERRLIFLAIARFYGMTDPKQMKQCFFSGGCDLSTSQVKERMQPHKTTGPFKTARIEWYELGAFIDGCQLKSQV